MADIRVMAVVAVAALAANSASADPRLPEISQTGVFETDVVAAAQGTTIPGSAIYALRDGTTVHYLASNRSHDQYSANPKAYPDIEP
ncbi:MAG TPA: hypothetical protein VFW46_21215, partial [Stellaceae bacterium]|nr:hypothetical protein [Stellaceae bacterium]